MARGSQNAPRGDLRPTRPRLRAPRSPTPLDQLLKRHFWAVIAALVAIAAFLDAQGVMHLVGARLGPEAAQLATSPLAARLPAAASSGSPHATSATPIL